MPRPEFRSKDQIIDEVIRVNHAGEYGAVEIYKNQIKQTHNEDIKSIFENMYEGEKIHLEYFINQIRLRNIRPTIMLPFWKLLGSFFGSMTAKYGTNFAMLLTENVETVIDQHYTEQLSLLSYLSDEDDLIYNIQKFRKEELEHKTIAIDNGSQSTPMYNIISITVKYGCNIAIYISKKI